MILYTLVKQNCILWIIQNTHTHTHTHTKQKGILKRKKERKKSMSKRKAYYVHNYIQHPQICTNTKTGNRLCQTFTAKFWLRHKVIQVPTLHLLHVLCFLWQIPLRKMSFHLSHHCLKNIPVKSIISIICSSHVKTSKTNPYTNIPTSYPLLIRFMNNCCKPFIKSSIPIQISLEMCIAEQVFIRERQT